MFERFSEASRRVLVLAQEEARALGHDFLGTEHLLLGLLHDGDGIAGRALASLGVELPTARQVVQTVGPTAPSPGGSPPFTPRTKHALELSLRAALELDAEEIAPEHLLLGVIAESGGVGAQTLVRLGLELDEVRRRVFRFLSERGEAAPVGPPAADDSRSVSESPEPVRGPTNGPRTDPPRRGPVSTLVACSFCGRMPPDSGQVIAGDGAFICEHCVHEWSRRLRPIRQLGSTRPLPTRPVALRRPPSGRDIRPGPEPDDPDAARREIAVAYLRSGRPSDDGRSVPSVERGGNLGPILAAAKEHRPHDTSRNPQVSVDEIAFEDARHAAVLFSVLIDGQPVLSRHRGDAVFVEGGWKMSRSTFCGLMRLAGVACPPDDRP